MNSSKPYAGFLAYSNPKLHCRFYTLILPSIRIASCSNSHIDTVERCCRSLKMKLIGGKRTFPLPPPPPPPRPVIVRSVDFASRSRDEGVFEDGMERFLWWYPKPQVFRRLYFKVFCLYPYAEKDDLGPNVNPLNRNEQSNYYLALQFL